MTYEYGHVSTDPAELERLRDDWLAVQQAARQSPPAQTDDQSPQELEGQSS